jgi:hypothetical protein
MICALLPTCSRSPQNRREYQYGQQKKYASNFEPDFAADAAKGLEEAA